MKLRPPNQYRRAINQDAVNKARVRLCDCYSRIMEAKREASPLAVLAFPLGSQVYWQHGGGYREATVVGHADALVRVRGTTGSLYWVDAQKLCKG